MGAASNYALNASFIITQPSSPYSSSLPTAFCIDEKRGPTNCETEARLNIVCSARVYLNASRCASAWTGFPFIIAIRLSGHCWRHRLSHRTLIGSAGDDELQLDEVEMN